MASWKAQAAKAGKKLAEWIRERCNGAVPEVRADAEIPAPKRRKPAAGELDLPVLGEQHEAKSGKPVCEHGVEKGWRCWQCGGIANV